MARPLHDLVIVVPGITGSVLQRAGSPIWAPSHRFAARAVADSARAAERLKLVDGDTGKVQATALMPDAHMVGGLVKIDGYSSIADGIERNFHVVRARPGQAHAANLIEFPYDWRLDNRVNAERLANVVGPALDSWRRYAESPRARVVFIAHSMGGLLTRYYLEVLGGWRDCRALITFGTPFRGSVDPIGYLANGYKRLHLDLTAAMRSFPSVYQLLPIFPALRTASGYRRVGETTGLPNIDAVRAADALAFHREIETAVAANDREATDRYALVPVVGTHQPTYQSAVLTGGAVTLSRELPCGVEAFLAREGIDGDGRVPISSAVPIDLSDSYHDVYHATKHGSLQNSKHVLGDLIGKLAKMQTRHLRKVRGPDPTAAFCQPALSVSLDDGFAQDEPVDVEVTTDNDVRLEEVMAEITSLVTGERQHLPLKQSGDAWRATVSPLAPGAYRCTVAVAGTGDVPAPVTDLFEVVAG